MLSLSCFHFLVCMLLLSPFLTPSIHFMAVLLAHLGLYVISYPPLPHPTHVHYWCTPLHHLANITWAATVFYRDILAVCFQISKIYILKNYYYNLIYIYIDVFAIGTSSLNMPSTLDTCHYQFDACHRP